jgi:tetratricopeptide (TPR) repeat protein
MRFDGRRVGTEPAVDQQRFFRQLGAFGGSCDLDAVAAVAETLADPLDEVAGLVDMSLVRIFEDHDGEPRVDLLQTVRAFARERLEAAGEWESTARKQAEHYLAVVAELAPRLRTSEYLTARDRIESELDNLRAALEWSLQENPHGGDANVGFRLCQELTWFWYACGYPQEGRRWLERAVERVSGEGPEEIAVLHGLGVILLQQGDSEKARQLLSRCLDYWRGQGDDSQTAKELNSLAIAYRNTDRHDQARALFTEGISLANGAVTQVAWQLYCPIWGSSKLMLVLRPLPSIYSTGPVSSRTGGRKRATGSTSRLLGSAPATLMLRTES